MSAVNGMASTTTKVASLTNTQESPTLDPWRRTRDGWQILDLSRRRPVRSSVSQTVLLLHPMIGASLMGLLSIFALIAFERDSRA